MSTQNTEHARNHKCIHFAAEEAKSHCTLPMVQMWIAFQETLTRVERLGELHIHVIGIMAKQSVILR